MRKPLLALMRGEDGRSLARALIALLLLNLFVAGFHTGVQASAAPGAGVLCSLMQTGATGDPQAPASDHQPPCCTIGCPSPAIAELPQAPVAAVAPLPAPDALFTLPVTLTPEATTSPAHRPRGPPSFA